VRGDAVAEAEAWQRVKEAFDRMDVEMDLHIRAMAAPGAAGQRFLCLADGPTISFLELAGILRQRTGPLGAKVNVQEEPGQDPPRLVIHNDKARTELGFRPRPVETTIVESAESLRDLGLLA
jgi:dihydroflavonol-4-reductase